MSENQKAYDGKEQTPANTPEPQQEGEKQQSVVVHLNLSKYPELLEELQTKADREVRTLRQQIIFTLMQAES